MAALEKLTTNKSNWSGEEVTVMVDRENLTFELYDYHFRLVFVPFERLPGETDEEWAKTLKLLGGPGIYEIHGEEWPEGTVLGKIYPESGDFVSSDMGIEREGKDPVESAVKLLSNTI